MEISIKSYENIGICDINIYKDLEMKAKNEDKFVCYIYFRKKL